MSFIDEAPAKRQLGNHVNSRWTKNLRLTGQTTDRHGHAHRSGGKPVAMICRRRSSCRSTMTLRSRRGTLVATVAPVLRISAAGGATSTSNDPNHHLGAASRAITYPTQTLTDAPIFFFSRTFLPQLLPRSLCSGAAQQGVPRQADAHPRWGMRLAAGPSSQRASARSSCKAGSGPAALTWASPGSSRSDAASAPCAATEMIPLHR